MTQSFNIPDSISTGDLQELFENAPTGDAIKAPADLTSQDLTELAEGILHEATEPLDGAQACLLHKIMFHAIAEQQLAFHSKMGHELSQQGEHVGAMAWLRDAGKWQAILNIATTISGGEDDPTATNA